MTNKDSEIFQEEKAKKEIPKKTHRIMKDPKRQAEALKNNLLRRKAIPIAIIKLDSDLKNDHVKRILNTEACEDPIN